MALRLEAFKAPDYFDLTSRTIDEIEIKERLDKTTCMIVSRKDSSEMFKGFKLTNHPKINTLCDIKFYPSGSKGKYIPRLIFKKVDKDFATKDQKLKEQVRIDLDQSETADSLWKMLGFLFQFKELFDVGDFEKTYRVIDSASFILEFDTKEKADKIRVLSELIEKSDLSEDQIESVLKQNREITLKQFNKLLTKSDAWKEYESKYKTEMKGTGEEAVWHHFLKKHHWLLGLNVDIRFIRDLIPEGSVGITDTQGRGSPFADFIGLADYTTLIELKTPKTKIFTEKRRATARANTWSFSDDFIDGVSQCLGQKFDWDKSSKAKDLVKEGEVVDQDLIRTADPKIVFLIGKKTEFPGDSKDVAILTKRDTFERFRRNSRNVEILTYDELYERAYFIVPGVSAPLSNE